MPTRISTKSSSQNVAQSPTHQLARSPFALAIIASAVTYAFSSAAEANDAMDHYEVIEVQGATPLSANSNNSAVFGNVQTLTQDDIEGSVNRSLPELLKTQLASVNLNDVQNNPFQPDLQYRGFTASPLLGLPQGISVYLNGGRVNEAFGDTVHWDLMPLDAIDTVSLYSGSNPLFGQNTLGGALALRTKTGFSFNANEIDLHAEHIASHLTPFSIPSPSITLESASLNSDSGYLASHWVYRIAFYQQSRLQAVLAHHLFWQPRTSGECYALGAATYENNLFLFGASDTNITERENWCHKVLSMLS